MSPVFLLKARTHAFGYSHGAADGDHVVVVCFGAHRRRILSYGPLFQLAPPSIGLSRQRTPFKPDIVTAADAGRVLAVGSPVREVGHRASAQGPAIRCGEAGRIWSEVQASLKKIDQTGQDYLPLCGQWKRCASLLAKRWAAS